MTDCSRFCYIKFISKYSWVMCLNTTKTYPIDTEEDVRALLRQSRHIKKIDRLHKNRPFLLAEKLNFDNDGKLQAC